MRLAFAAVDEQSTRQGKSQLRRIVSMRTRLIQRTDREPDAGPHNAVNRSGEVGRICHGESIVAARLRLAFGRKMDQTPTRAAPDP